MLTSTSPPVLRLHPERPIAKSSGHFPANCAFDKLNRAFQLATGWTLGLNTFSEAEASLFVDDLSEATFGKATVGRTYAENLIDQLNAFLRHENGSRQNGARQPSHDLFSNEKLFGSSETSELTSSLRHEVNRGGLLPDSMELPRPQLINFDVAFGSSAKSTFSHNYHVTNSGKLAILLQFRSGVDDSEKGLGAWAGHEAINQAKLDVAFDCLAATAADAADLSSKIARALSKHELEEVSIPSYLGMLDDLQFHFELLVPEQTEAQPCSTYILDFCLGRIHKVDEGKRDASTAKLAPISKWIGYGHSLLVAREQTAGLKLTHAAERLFQDNSLSRLAAGSGQDVLDQINRILAEPGSASYCPLLIKRKL